VKKIKITKPEEIILRDSTIIEGDAFSALSRLPSNSVQCIVTSPPYWGLRDYKIAGQIGLEATVDQFLNRLVAVFAEARRVLKKDGTLWLNIGDSYTSGNRKYRAPDKKNPARTMDVRPDTPEGLKPKDLMGIPWKLAFRLQQDGWFLRSDIVWNKPNCQPESVKDRPTRAHEYIFLFSKSKNYYYNYEAIKEPSVEDGKLRNKRSVWDVRIKPYNEAHFAVFPPELITPCILAGSKPGSIVLDPFFGSGTVGEVCQNADRFFVGIELNPEYINIATNRLRTYNDNIINLRLEAA
jgi:site-specific DNA-methyltransferase (adenine-specific)